MKRNRDEIVTKLNTISKGKSSEWIKDAKRRRKNNNMNELQEVLDKLDLDAVSLGSMVATIIKKDYGKHSCDLFIDSFKEVADE